MARITALMPRSSRHPRTARHPRQVCGDSEQTGLHFRRVANEGTTSNIARRRAAALDDARPEYVERRREIVRAAAGVFKARGFAGTTLGHVAEALGVDRASLYYY